MIVTDITALVERLRQFTNWQSAYGRLMVDAADALEALQLERDAALFDKAVAGGKVRVVRNAALEEVATWHDKQAREVSDPLDAQVHEESAAAIRLGTMEEAADALEALQAERGSLEKQLTEAQDTLRSVTP